MRWIIFFAAFIFLENAGAQNLSAKLAPAISSLEKDPQFTHAIVSMYVVETASGNILFEHNAQIGLAPASCQKVITSVSAFELLGSDFRYKTLAYLSGRQTGDEFSGNIHIKASGDPTLGSWRFASTKNDRFFEDVLSDLHKKGIKKLNGKVESRDMEIFSDIIPRGWIWEDIGNYYGAGAGLLNWHENQYDVLLKAGDNIGSAVNFVDVAPDPGYEFENLLSTGAKGTGDNAYIFPGLNNADVQVSGTIPLGENNFRVSGSVSSPADFFIHCFNGFLEQKNIKKEIPVAEKPTTNVLLTTYTSPTLDSINYWFLKKSINLYGEALVKSIALEKQGTFAAPPGLSAIKKFWNEQGIDSASLKMQDGSGLSPANRITTNALVTVMQFAKKQSWFPSFYNALPEMNGIKMKDGYIGGVRSYTGYIKSKDGKEYTFSFIVNNFDGNPGTVREKIWRVLDVMKGERQ